MKIIVLGAAGMLGHVAAIYLKEKYGPRVVASARNKTGIALIDEGLEEIDLSRFEDLKKFLESSKPCVVINCAAINDGRRDPEELRRINAELPQATASLLDQFKDGSRLIHISTDGVFEGNYGYYSEDDLADAEDPYGKSKLQGEVSRDPHLTVRTSIVGPDPVKSRGLMNWFFSQSGEVKGFRHMLWSGVTTLELVRFIDHAVTQDISGLYHLGGDCISKYDLLMELKKVFPRECVIIADDQKRLNRCLVTKREEIFYTVPPFSMMLQQLKLWMSEHPQIYRSIDPL